MKSVLAKLWCVFLMVSIFLVHSNSAQAAFICVKPGYLSTVDYGEYSEWYCDDWWGWEWTDEFGWVEYIICYDCINCEYYTTGWWAEDMVSIPNTISGRQYRVTVGFSNGSQDIQTITGNGGTLSLFYWYDDSTPYPIWVSVGEDCAIVIQVSGIPPVVCLGEVYLVTATSDGLPFTEGVIWGGSGIVTPISAGAAWVQFTSTGTGSIWGRTPAQGSPAQNYPLVVTVSYTIPSRHGNSSLPVSIPLGVTTGINVTISPPLPAGKALNFKIVGDPGGGAGSATLGNPTLTGNGGLLQVTGTVQSAPNHPNFLRISTAQNWQPFSECGTSPNFSVCAHPVGIAWSWDSFINAVVMQAPGASPGVMGRYWGVKWSAVVESDSGNTPDLYLGATMREYVTAVQSSGVLYGTEGGAGPWSGVDAISDSQLFGANNGTSSPPLTSEVNDFLLQNGSNGYSLRTQLFRFACSRCGIQQSAEAPLVAASGAAHTKDMEPPPTGTSYHKLTIWKDGYTGSGVSASSSPDAGPWPRFIAP